MKHKLSRNTTDQWVSGSLHVQFPEGFKTRLEKMQKPMLFLNNNVQQILEYFKSTFNQN